MAKIYEIITDTDDLTLEQFVTMCMDQRCNEKLRSLMLKIKYYRDSPKTRNIGKEIGMTKYLPFTFKNMGKHLCYQINREKQINIYEAEGKLKRKNIPKQMNCLVKLMKLNMDAVHVSELKEKTFRAKKKVQIMNIFKKNLIDNKKKSGRFQESTKKVIVDLAKFST